MKPTIPSTSCRQKLDSKKSRFVSVEVNKNNPQNKKLKSKGVKPTVNHFESSEKILNVSPNQATFLSAFDTFENALDQLTDVDCDKQIFEKLLQVRDRINIEISYLEHLSDKKEFQTLGLSKSVSSIESLLSETKSVSVQKNASFEEFMSRVNCPFCSELQSDKISLIQHLDKTCRSIKNEVFEEKIHLPFASFQILPNNTFKCNICVLSVLRDLKHLFAHAQSELHFTAYSDAAKSKKLTEFLFCSSCKILVPNNYTQLYQHINHSVHKERSKLAPLKLSQYNKKEIACVYIKTKKFKCILCPSQSLCKSPKDILEHLGNLQHEEKFLSKSPSVFCEFCHEKIHIFEVLSHFSSDKHQNMEVIEEIYEMCSYCAFTCSSLKLLALHMKSQCQEINFIRTQNQNLNATVSNDKSSKEQNLNESGVKKQNKNERERESGVKKQNKNENLNGATEGENVAEKQAICTIEKKTEIDQTKKLPHIIVKGNIKLPELYKCFKEFGDIAAVEILKGENMLFQFRERRVVEDILLLRGLIKINGVKVDISTDEDLFESSEEKEKQSEEVRVSSSNIQRDSQSVIESESKDRDLEPIQWSHQTENLFSTAASHLLHSTQKYVEKLRMFIPQDFDKYLFGITCLLSKQKRGKLLGHHTCHRCDDIMTEDILKDCTEILGTRPVAVGFLACGLAFPVENIRLYSKMTYEMIGSVSSEIHASLTGNHHFHKNLIKKFSTKFFDSSKWQEGMCSHDGIFPYIESKHKETQKICSFTFMESAKYLTEMLRQYMGPSTREFCLIVRFWLAVHELEIREFEYVIISLLIFFLCSRNERESFLQVPGATFDTAVMFLSDIQEEISAFKVPRSSRGSGHTARQLFTEFLYFLLKFDFDKYAICLPITYPIPKTLFMRPQFVRYFQFLDLNLIKNTSLCIIDPELKLNLAAGVGKNDLKSLLRIAEINYK